MHPCGFIRANFPQCRDCFCNSLTYIPGIPEHPEVLVTRPSGFPQRFSMDLLGFGIAMALNGVSAVRSVSTCEKPCCWRKQSHKKRKGVSDPTLRIGPCRHILDRNLATADSSQFNVFCYQPVPVPDISTARSSQLTLQGPCRLFA